MIPVRPRNGAGPNGSQHQGLYHEHFLAGAFLAGGAGCALPGVVTGVVVAAVAMWGTAPAAKAADATVTMASRIILDLCERSIEFPFLA